MNEHISPLVSVLIPYHNGEKTILQTVQSVFEQHDIAYEVIIVDDRSTPTARRFVDDISKKYADLFVVDACGSGPSAARNTGVRYARGKYLCFLDADDCLNPNALKTLCDTLTDNPDIGVVFGRVRITPSPGENAGTLSAYCPAPTLPQIAGENRICTASNIVTRQTAFKEIGPFDETLNRAEDQEWLARAFFCPHWKIRGISMVTLDYRTSIGGLSTDLSGMEDGWVTLMRRLKISGHDISRKMHAEIKSQFYRYLARRALRLKTSRCDAGYYMIIALTASPKIIWTEFRRTVPTAIASVAVMVVGNRPFNKVFL